MNQPPTASPFHPGELEVQTRLGVRDSAAGIGERMVHNHLPLEHSLFFAQLPFILIGAVDSKGRPWASILIGQPGFIESPEPKTLNINTQLVNGDPLGSSLSPGTEVGLLGIEYHSRRRNRATGKVSEYNNQRVSIRIDQAFGNCPQYIQSRDYELLPGIEAIGGPLASKKINGLGGRAREIISTSDHFYIATHFSENSDIVSHGADVSHRGGKPGFVHIEEETKLIFPDFSGNNLFNTIGNILLNPKTGLLFIDYEDGDLLYLTGQAEIIWDSEQKRAFVGAERLVQFTLDEGVIIEKAVPIRWRFGDYSPSLTRTGSWQEVADNLLALKEGAEYHNYRVVRVAQESATISSFYLEAEADGKIPCHIAGQFLPIQIQPPGIDEPVGRTYTISNAPNGNYFRLSIKREPAAKPDLPVGLSSNYFHDHITNGSIIRALSPRGKFTLNESSARPVVLISGGVGITPMISMLEQLVDDSKSCGTDRPIWFIHGAINSKVHAFRDHVLNLSQELPGLTTHTRYSNPSDKDISNNLFDSIGYVDIELFKKLLPLDDYDFYMCGPPSFMESLHEGLKSINVDEARIHYEFFGPGATLNQDGGNRDLVEQIGEQKPVAVQFKRSAIEAVWDPSKGTLLDLAESEGLQPAYSCRSGICQTCATKVSQGNVTYLEPPMVDPEQGTALICCCYPQAMATEDGKSLPLVLDL